VFTLDMPLRLLSEINERKNKKIWLEITGRPKFAHQYQKGLFMEHGVGRCFF
jgi:hypothetical protein